MHVKRHTVLHHHDTLCDRSELDILRQKDMRRDTPCRTITSPSTNLVGKFTQSVRRIVQDVKDEGTSSGQTKEEVIETNERLRAVRVRLDENYDTAKKALVTLMTRYCDSKAQRNVFTRYQLLKDMIKEYLDRAGMKLALNYDTAKKALVTLMTRYCDSKAQRNVFTRYQLLKDMIKDVIRLETQYWSLVEIPKQEKAETVPAFVLRACSIMEKTQKSGEGVKTSTKLAEEAADRRERIERLNGMFAFVLRACSIMEKTQKSGEGVKTSTKLAEEAADRRERIERLNDMTTSQIEAENTQMTNDLYRLLKKYSGLRNLIRMLKSEYMSTKMYPMIPRYTMLKDMIKDIMHDPDYMEVCHEVDP
ncbi:hypothetical protein NE865_09891 [Phthorimaea operculella]|nr:hypothetical protein NE865_09891 [Phthorimaea operculella]